MNSTDTLNAHEEIVANNIIGFHAHNEEKSACDDYYHSATAVRQKWCQETASQRRRAALMIQMQLESLMIRGVSAN